MPSPIRLDPGKEHRQIAFGSPFVRARVASHCQRDRRWRLRFDANWHAGDATPLALERELSIMGSELHELKVPLRREVAVSNA